MGIEWREQRAVFGMNYCVSMQTVLVLLLLHPTTSYLQLPKATFMWKKRSQSPRNEAVLAAALDETMTLSHPSGKEFESENENEACPLQRKSLRRKIPYVESLGEQVARELWEQDPFQATDYVLDSVICSENDTFDQPMEAILTPIQLTVDNPTLVSLSGYEDSFDTLYKRTRDDHLEPPRGDVFGTASITSSSFAKILDNHETRKEKMNHFCLQVAYRGNDFCGWQTQLDNKDQPSVQRTLEEWLTELQNDEPLDAEANAESKKARRIQKQSGKDDASNAKGNMVTPTTKSKKPKIKWADLPVAGRTDSGVSAIGQLCRYRTYRKDLNTETIAEYLFHKVKNTPHLSRSLRVTQITPVTKAFHPTFTTECRAYAYLIDIDAYSTDQSQNRYTVLDNDQAATQVALLDAMLQSIEGKTLDYIGLSYGKVKTTNTLCTLYHARARWVEYQNPVSTTCEEIPTQRAVCIELVGDRFLRRMVRLLVEASVRLVAEATAKPALDEYSTDDDPKEEALLRLIEKQDRTLVGRPAPPDGLIFVAARVQS